MLTRGWFHDGSRSAFRGRGHGRPFPAPYGHRLLGYLQTHDQIGNRAVGDRLSASLAPGRLAAGAALVLTSPFTPMLFMGEEWGAGTPWQYFTDHTDPELAQAVRLGRRREFAEHGWSAEEVPDPQDRATVLASTLDWAEPAQPPHAELLAWYRLLLRLRREHPELGDPDLAAVRVRFDEEQRWLVVHRGPYRIAVNLGAEGHRTVPLGAPAGRPLALFGSCEADGDSLVLAHDSTAVVRV